MNDGQQDCLCATAGSSIAAALGGGIFAGLLASALHHPHPVAAGAAADSTIAVASTPVAGAPNPDSATIGAEAKRLAVAGVVPAAPLPAYTSSAAAAEGLVAPKTSTFLPALGMIAVGVLVLGILFLRGNFWRR